MEPETVTNLVSAIEQGHWALVAGLGLMVLVWVGRRFVLKKKLPAKAIPIINASVGVIMGVADGLMGGEVSWYQALASGLMTGAAAGGFWSMVGKHVLPLPDAEDEEPPAEES